jgi:hypothetical protein
MLHCPSGESRVDLETDLVYAVHRSASDKRVVVKLDSLPLPVAQQDDQDVAIGVAANFHTLWSVAASIT